MSSSQCLNCHSGEGSNQRSRAEEYEIRIFYIRTINLRSSLIYLCKDKGVILEERSRWSRVRSHRLRVLTVKDKKPAPHY